ncbi:unnamed protein product [Candidula unifasciata]|uniref:Ribonucleases P/MRP subunit Pop8-like domain-containing protein n=1 Tax=Candidula unifasciata TaxID=100452 RepID=A0A8S3YUC3_9EUPU|nr:unnamed protein product [Candidula unifasciata]
MVDADVKTKCFISEKKQPYLYMKVSLTIDGEDVGQLTPVQYKYLIMQALKETLGQIGASYTVDLLKLSSNGVALLRLPRGYSDKLWAALTMYGATPAKRRCAFRVLQVSPFLMGLVVDSRWQQ